MGSGNYAKKRFFMTTIIITPSIAKPLVSDGQGFGASAASSPAIIDEGLFSK